MFKVDVITPVFNNIQFIKRCIESAHIQEEVNNIIVIDDGSNDGTFEFLNTLKPVFPKLKLITHEGRINKGIACSRNLGIMHAVASWIAFLDSDDYYLPDRFKYVSDIFVNHPHIECVYEPVMNSVESHEGAKRFLLSENIDGTIIKINQDVASGKVFDSMYSGKGGVVHLNGLVLTKQLAAAVNFFDEELRIVDDSVFRLKVAYKGSLMQGSLKPVAIRTIHDTNNEPRIQSFDIFRKHEVLLTYIIAWNADIKLKRNLIKRTLLSYIKYRQAKTPAQKLIHIVKYVCFHPRIIFNYIL